jgi:hypothetical protein
VGTAAAIPACDVDAIGEEWGGLPHLPCPGMHPCPTCEREPNKGLTEIECEVVVSVADQGLTKE